MARQRREPDRRVPALAAGERAGRRPDRAPDRQPPRAPRRGQAHDRLRRRVLARQERTDQRHLLRRLRPASAALLDWAHHDVSHRAAVGCDPVAVHPAAADRDAGDPRHDERVQAVPRRVARDPARRRRRAGAGRGVPAGARDEARADRGGEALRSLRQPRLEPGRGLRRRRHGGDPVLAPRGDQFPAPPPRAGPRHPRHAGAQRDRHRAGADAEPAAERARGAVHPRRRHRGVEDRRRRVERLHRHRARSAAGPLRGGEQDRHPLGRAAERRGHRRRGRRAVDVGRRRAAGAGRAGACGVGAEGAGGEDHRRRVAARAEPPARARARALHPAHPGQAVDRARDHAARGRRPHRQHALDPRGPPRGRARAAGRAARPCAARTSTWSRR